MKIENQKTISSMYRRSVHNGQYAYDQWQPEMRSTDNTVHSSNRTVSCLLSIMFRRTK